MGESKTKYAIPPRVITLGFQKTVPWIWVIFCVALFFGAVWALLPGDFVQYGNYFLALFLLCAIPGAAIAVHAAFLPAMEYYKGRSDADDPVTILYYKKTDWVQDLFVLTFSAVGVYFILISLGYPEAFISTIITVFLIALAVYSLFLKLPPRTEEMTREYRAFRYWVIETRILLILSACAALMGYVRLGWRLFWLLITVLGGIFIIGVIQSLIGNILKRLLELDYSKKEDESTYRGIRFKRNMEKNARLVNFFSRNICLFAGLYVLLLVAGVPVPSLNAFVNKAFFTAGSLSLSISSALQAYFTVLLALIAGGIIRDGLLFFLLPKTELDLGTSQALSNIAFILVVGGGIVTAISLLGVNVLAIGLIGGGLAVGIGFGLQNIVNNIISGVILFFERPINVGDVIDVADTAGTVQQIGIRSTVVTTFKNISVIIPNSELISGTVVNWSWGDITMRLEVPVGVAYGTDIHLVKEILLDIATQHNLISNHPPADVLFDEFADSSLNFTLRVWIKDLRKRREILSDVNYMIDARFRKANIEIPFPQRDVYIRGNVEPSPQPEPEDQAEAE